jgi:hypothetical protein
MKSRILSLSLAGVLAAGAASAQSLPLKGKIFSASAAISANGTTTVFTTPLRGDVFVLTEACTTGGITLSGKTFGTITRFGSILACLSFSPGFALPANEDVQCTDLTGNPDNCSISGVLVPR